MAEPVNLRIFRRGSIWTLARDRETVADYSHLDRATHEAVGMARALSRTGEPARVLIEAADGKVVEIDAGPITPDRPLPPDDGVDWSRS